MRESDLILESRRLCDEIKQLLPKVSYPSLDATFLAPAGGVTVKVPSKLAGAVGALIWRAHDFASLACDLFDARRVIPGAVIVRSLMETTALVYVLHQKTARAVVDRNVQELDEFLVRCLSGNRLATGDPESPNVLSAIDKLEKEPGAERYKDFYESLCEFAHPNSLGSFYAYAKFNDSTHALSFGHNQGLTRGEDLAFALVFALEVLIEFAKKVEALMPQVVTLAKDLYPQGAD
jgi:hypothetical protein